MKTNNKRRRIMGELIFDGDAEAEAIGAELRAAGFDFKITEGSDDTRRFMMAWIDVPPDEREENDVMRFVDIVSDLVGETPDDVGIVALDHVPEKFGDFGASLPWPRGRPTQ